jgi:uncharacterized protein YcbX
VRIAGLWRYPVKGLLGEALDEATFTEHGVTGDRSWAVVGADGKLGSGKTTRRFRRMPNLFTMSSAIVDDVVVVTVGDWRGEAGDPATAQRVSDVVGEPVTLQPASAIPVRVHDEGPVHVLTTSLLDGEDARRFRPNVVLDGDRVLEGDLALGDVVLRVLAPMPRCVMTTLAQPAHGLGFEPRLARLTELGVVAAVAVPGTSRVSARAR